MSDKEPYAMSVEELVINSIKYRKESSSREIVRRAEDVNKVGVIEFLRNTLKINSSPTIAGGYDPVKNEKIYFHLQCFEELARNTKNKATIPNATEMKDNQYRSTCLKCRRYIFPGEGLWLMSREELEGWDYAS